MFPPDSIPPEVEALCRRLAAAGHAAYVVGGAVRDLLRLQRGDAAKDFDIATTAPPQEVTRLFGPGRTIPTGIAHGTVTVLCDRKNEQRPRHVEVTTFRGEVGYSDGRRPDRVEFIGDLTEDLRRRDFTINAIAYDPLALTLHDPFDGQGDLRREIIRAVGEPEQRFAEDGLRLLRAVRFAAQLGFAIETATRAAFTAALPTLRKVSRERVRDELQRLLLAPLPSRGLIEMLEPAPLPREFCATAGLLGVVLPELATKLDGAADGLAARRFMALVDAVPCKQRMAALLWPLRESATNTPPSNWVERLEELLKLPTQERQFLSALLSFSDLEYRPHPPWPDAAVRRLMARYPAALLDDYLSLRQAELLLLERSEQRAELQALEQRIAAERRRQPPLQIADLAVTGKDLMDALGLRPGPTVGATLRHLLEYVLEEPEHNRREALLSEATRYGSGEAAPRP
jgi:tRNA nucleotidyltransferase (CCA-adding enzyme)